MADEELAQATLRKAFSDAMYEAWTKVQSQAQLEDNFAGSGYGPAVIELSDRYPVGLAKGVIHEVDGRTRLVVIHATRVKGAVTVKVEQGWNDADEFWEPRARHLSSRNLIVNHKFYSLGEERRDSAGKLLPGNGFGGRLVRFRRITEHSHGDVPAALGPVEETRNLWFGGVIPPAWRDRLRDNAEFLGEFDGPVR